MAFQGTPCQLKWTSLCPFLCSDLSDYVSVCETLAVRFLIIIVLSFLNLFPIEIEVFIWVFYSSASQTRGLCTMCSGILLNRDVSTAQRGVHGQDFMSFFFLASKPVIRELLIFSAGLCSMQFIRSDQPLWHYLPSSPTPSSYQLPFSVYCVLGVLGFLRHGLADEMWQRYRQRSTSPY